MTRPPAGLCDACRHQQLIRNTRGSEFSLCLRSRSGPERYPKYPRLPVTACPGYERLEEPGEPAPADPPTGDRRHGLSP